MKSFHYDIVDSTNSVAKELLKTHDEVIVTADVQSAGRGRNGHNWESGIGTDILFTYAVKSAHHSNKQPIMYQACSALAVQAFLLEILPQEADIAIKYPNDIYVRMKDKIGKISGSLIEVEYIGNQLYSIITGIGVNINSHPLKLNEHATSMTVSDIMNTTLNLRELYDSLTQKFLWFLANDQDYTVESWFTAMNIIGKQITHVQSGLVYTVQGITIDGFLQCTRDEEVITLHSGDSVQYNLF
jgi:biotin-[acetyl-CoA-carboxylase] ligase BirA-like protein